MRTLLRFIYVCVVGLLQAFLLALLLGCVVQNAEVGALVFLFGWPTLTWRRWRKPALTPAAKAIRARRSIMQTILRGSILTLVLAPIILAIPVFMLVSAFDRGAGGSGIVAIFTLVIMSSVFLFCWGAAFMATLAHLGTRKKGP
ncbi:hypothetical protein ABT364_01260 [Massilia sp. SR12]